MDKRGVSLAVSYVLVIGIVTILTTTLFLTFGPFVTNQQHEAAHAGLEVVGQDLAGDLESADRLARQTDGNGSVQLQTTLPERIGGSLYEIEVEEDELTIRAADPEVVARISVELQMDIDEQTGSDALDGGTLVITYDSDAGDELVVENE